MTLATPNWVVGFWEVKSVSDLSLDSTLPGRGFEPDVYKVAIWGKVSEPF